MKGGSLHTRSFRRVHFSVVIFKWTKNGFTGPKSFRGFRETGPWSGNSVSLLHEVAFFIDRTGRFPWGVSDKKKRFDEAEPSQTITWELAMLFHQFSWRIYRRYIAKLTSVVFFLKIEINLHSKSTRFLYCYFWLRGKLVKNSSFKSLLIISPRSLHNFWNFPRYANHRCTGHATMSTEHGNDRLSTVHAPSC